MAKITTLQDSFHSNSLNTNLWSQFTAGSATILYGQDSACVKLPAASTSSTDGDISSVAAYDLTGSSVFMEVITVPNPATNADALLRVYTDANNWFRWIYEAGTLYAQRNKASVQVTLASFAYDPALHRWWRIRESGGVVYFDTSADGKTWTNQATYTHAMTITSMHVLVGATCFQNETNAGTFSWDSLNLISVMANIPTTYKYAVYSGSTYLGILPKVLSEFNCAQDINTPSAQLLITVGLDIDNSNLPNETLTNESGTTLTDESSNILTTTEYPDVYGTYISTSLIRNGNRIVVWEYSKYHINGMKVFQGTVKRWAAKVGTGDQVDVTVLSDGAELDNSIVFGSDAMDRFQISKTAFDDVYYNGGSNPRNLAQSFYTGSDVTEITGILLELGGSLDPSLVGSTIQLDLNVYHTAAPTALGPGLGSVAIQVEATADFTNVPMKFYKATFSTPIIVAPNDFYTFVLSGASLALSSLVQVSINQAPTNSIGQSWVYYSGSWTPTGYDLMFAILTSNTSRSYTNCVYINTDAGDMVTDFMTNYNTRGGHVTIGEVENTGLKPTRAFILNTNLEGVEAARSLSPSGFYWYVDVGSSELVFKRANPTPDHVFQHRVHLNELELLASIENVKNEVYLTAGFNTNGSTTMVYSQNDESIGKYGGTLDRITDDRVIDAYSGHVISDNYTLTHGSEEYQSTITISDTNYDISSVHLGDMVKFSGFSSFADTIMLQVVRIERYPNQLVLSLGALPKRSSNKAEVIDRSVNAIQTANNPTSSV
jgi:hypothetical protein